MFSAPKLRFAGAPPLLEVWIRPLALIGALALLPNCSCSGPTALLADAGSDAGLDLDSGADAGLQDAGPSDAGEDDAGPPGDGDAGPFHEYDSGAIVPDLGPGHGAGSGVVALPDGGGIALGGTANFRSNFAYIANSGQAQGDSFVSRVDTATGIEVARYPSVVPIDNQGALLCAPGDLQTCLIDVGPTYYDNAPSRTVVDLNGGVFVANRGQCDWTNCAPGGGKFQGYSSGAYDSSHLFVQGSVTYVANYVDHPEQCAPRCANRLGWALPDGGSFPFTAGATLPLAGDSSLTLPSNEVLMPSAGSDAGLAPDVWAHPCLWPDGGVHDPGDVTDPTNYDDCARFSIPLGAPNGYDLPDASYDDRFAPRGLAISKTCGSFEGIGQSCDLYVGLTEPHAETAQVVHLDHRTNFGVKNTIDTHLPELGVYGAAIDCEGVLWGSNRGSPQTLVGIDTATDELVTQWGYTDNGGQPRQAYTVPEPSKACIGYGIAVDLNHRVWSAEVTGTGNSKMGACSFDFAGFQSQLDLQDGGLSLGSAQSLIQSDWKTFSFTNQFPTSSGTGIVADRDGTVYLAGHNGSTPGSVAFNFDGAGSACGQGGDSPCLWSFAGVPGLPFGSGTMGVDLDQDGNPWTAQRGGNRPGVLALDRTSGQLLPFFADGGISMAGPGGVNDIYSYSDFTGYALRNITQPSGSYQQIFSGCPESLEPAVWESLSYGADLPSGTNLAFEVDLADDLAAFSGGGHGIQGSYGCAAAASCPSPVTLPASLPPSFYARVTVTLSAPTCNLSGVTPTLQWLKVGFDCPKPVFH